MIRNSSNIFRSLLVATLALCFASISWAGGGKNYPLGSEDFLSGMAPPPGYYFLNYAYYYKADDKTDNSGSDLAVFDEATVAADVLRFIWISDKKIFDGFYGQHLFIPYMDVDVDFKQAVGSKNKKHYSDEGVPYIIYSPFILSWHLMEGKFHLVTSLCDIYIPTGNDDKGNPANVSRNYWGFEPVLAATWLPTDKIALSIKLMYDFYSSQDDYATPYGDLDRDPGQEFHFDYSVSYALTPAWRLGINGYFHQQTTEDDYDMDQYIGTSVEGALRDAEEAKSRVFAIGPGVWYNYKNMFFSLKSQYESHAKTMTEGYNVWFKFTYAF